MKIAFLSGRPKNGTILPKNEKYVWNEICRVMTNDLQNPLFKSATFLIPIYNKFDLYALHFAEKNSIKVEYYVPNKDWGLQSLPKHQTALIQRMDAPRHITPSNNGRLLKMIEDADIVYVLDETEGFEQFTEALKKTVVCNFPKDKMLYRSEEEALAYNKQLKENTKIYLAAQEVKKMEDNQASMNLLRSLFPGDTEIKEGDLPF